VLRLKGHTKIVRQTAVSGMVLRRRGLTVGPDDPPRRRRRPATTTPCSLVRHSVCIAPLWV